MPFLITKKDGKRFGLNTLFTAHEIGRLRDDPHCYTIVNTTSRRYSKVGAACTRPTPENLWGARRRRRRRSKRGLSGGLLEKLFGKKKSKVNPMSRRIYMVKTKSGTYIPATVASMQGARRRRKRRRR